MHESTMLFRKNLLTQTGNSQDVLHILNKVLPDRPRQLGILCYPNPQLLLPKTGVTGGRVS